MNNRSLVLATDGKSEAHRTMFTRKSNKERHKQQRTRERNYEQQNKMKRRRCAVGRCLQLLPVTLLPVVHISFVFMQDGCCLSVIVRYIRYY